MTENHSSNEKPKFTLKGEMQKRRTQEILRTVEEKRTGIPRNPTPNRNDPRRATQIIPASKPVTSNLQTATLRQTPASTEQPIASPQKTPENASWRKRVIVIASLLVVLVVFASVISLRSYTTAKVPTTSNNSAPVVNSGQLSDQFKQSDVQISGVRNIPVSSNSWHASQIIQFDAQENGSRGSFILVNYSPITQSGTDILKVAGDHLKGWQQIAATSAVLLIAPGTSPSLTADVSRQLGQFLGSLHATQTSAVS